MTDLAGASATTSARETAGSGSATASGDASVSATAGAGPGTATTGAQRTEAARREELLGRVDAIAPVLEGDATTSDGLRRLGDMSLAALREAGLLLLKVPAELGGFEAEPALQYEVFERVAYYSAPAAWCLFIYADAAGMVTARLPEAGLTRYVEAGGIPLTCGGGGLRPGRLTPDDGGFRLTGSWRYGSGIHAATWIMVSGYLPGGGDERGKVLQCVVPRAAVDVHDTWHVLGLKGTGSNDFSADEVFVPEALTFGPTSPPLRGGAQYRAGIVGYLAYTLPAVAVGIARRALDELVALAGTTMRGYSRPRPLAERGVFQSFLGEADQRLKAVRALMIANGLGLIADIERLGHSPPANEAETRAAAVHTVRTATDVVTEAVRFAGGTATRADHVLERALRDVHMLRSHLLVGDSAFENHAQFLLGIPGADPMA